MGMGFADRAAFVVVVGFSQDLWVLHISICTNINQKDEGT